MIQALIPLISAALTGITNVALSERQRSYDEQMMDKQNEYNLPGNQIQRLKDAGINPTTLGMGQGTVVQGNTSVSNNGYQLPNVLDPMSLASNSLLSLMQAKESEEKSITEKDSREVRIEQIKAETDKYREECALLGLDQKAQEIANDWADIMNQVAVMKDFSEIGLNESQTEKISSETDKVRYELQNVLPNQVKLLVEQGKLNVLEQDKVIAEIQRIYSLKNLQDKQSDYYSEMATSEWYKQAGYAADTAKSGAEEEFLRYQIQMYLDTYDEQASIVANNAKLTNRQVKSFWINMLLHGAQNLGVAAGGTAAAVKTAAALVPK